MNREADNVCSSCKNCGSAATEQPMAFPSPSRVCLKPTASYTPSTLAYKSEPSQNDQGSSQYSAITGHDEKGGMQDKFFDQEVELSIGPDGTKLTDKDIAKVDASIQAEDSHLRSLPDDVRYTWSVHLGGWHSHDHHSWRSRTGLLPSRQVPQRPARLALVASIDDFSPPEPDPHRTGFKYTSMLNYASRETIPEGLRGAVTIEMITPEMGATALTLLTASAFRRPPTHMVESMMAASQEAQTNGADGDSHREGTKGTADDASVQTSPASDDGLLGLACSTRAGPHAPCRQRT